MRTLTTAEVARILALPEARVRRLVRAGLCTPARRGRAYAFGFQDVVVLRAAKELLERGVPTARVRRAIEALAAELPPERPLSGLRIRADGRQVVVTEGGATWRPETGQLLLDFEVGPMAERVAGLSRDPAAGPPAQDEESGTERAGDRTSRAGPAAGSAAEGGAPGGGEAAASFRAAPAAAEGGEDSGCTASARALFEEALSLEDEDAKAAAAVYRRALAEDPALLDAWVNLGRLAHEAGHAREAVRLYHRALELAPEDPVVHYNVALALEDAKGPAPAVAHYERALALDPSFADAHYNLAGLCEALGRKADALRHYRDYKRLTEG